MVDTKSEPVRSSGPANGMRSRDVPVLSAHALLTALAVLPIALAKYPPLYDYFQWLYQGHILARLLPWGPSGAVLDPNLYQVQWAPIPNLGSIIGIGLLNTLFSSPNAGRLFVVITILVFSYGFACLVRTIQGRQTAVEFFGYIWAFGYFTYRGYLSFVLSLGIAMFALALLHRAAKGENVVRSCIALASLGLVTYLSHLFGWLVLLTGTCVYSLFLFRRNRRLAFGLVATTIPVAPLIAWYSSVSGDLRVQLYDGLGSQVVALVESLGLFLRTDPLPQPFPVAWASLIGGFAMLTALVVCVRGARGLGRDLQAAAVTVGLILIALAVALPLHNLSGLARPGQRLLFAGVLVLVASLPMKPIRISTGLLATAVVGSLLLLHAIEYRLASHGLEEMRSDVERSVPLDRSVYVLTIWRSRFDRRDPAGLPTLGTAATKWFDTQRLIDHELLYAPIISTSLLLYRPAADSVPRYAVDTIYDRSIRGNHKLLARLMSYDIVLVLAAPREVEAVEESTAGSHELIDLSPLTAVFRNTANDPQRRRRAQR